MNYWFITLLLLFSLNAGFAMAQHGKPKTDNHNFFVTIVAGAVETFIIYMAIKTGF